MTPTQWNRLKRAADGEMITPPPVALIVDSPWIPGHLGISTLDYMTVPEVWLSANLRICSEFPEIIFLPGFWMEIGMAAEPSAFGSRISLYADRTPIAHPVIQEIEQADSLPQPNPRSDGFPAIILNTYRRMEPAIRDAGHEIKIVAARGPLTTASHLMGVTEFLLSLKIEPEATHRLLRKTTRFTKEWLQVQAEVLTSVEGILILDDICGMMSADDYREFAHPYLKEIYDAFPGALKLFHNDTDNPVSYPFLPELGIDIFNFTHLCPLQKARDLIGPKVCLLGNVPPLGILANGTPQQVQESVRECLASHSQQGGLIISAGGGTSPGTPGANIRALIGSEAANFD